MVFQDGYLKNKQKTKFTKVQKFSTRSTESWLKKIFFLMIYTKHLNLLMKKKLNIFNKKELINYLKLYKKKKFNSFLIFQIYTFCKFHEKFFN